MEAAEGGDLGIMGDLDGEKRRRLEIDGAAPSKAMEAMEEEEEEIGFESREASERDAKG